MSAVSDRTTGRRWPGLVVLLLPTLLLTTDLGVLWLATPAISESLRPSSTELLWVNDSYGLVMASFLVLLGNVGDRVGLRRLLMIGVVGFGLASLLAAYAPNPGVLIAARATLGLSGAAMIPSTLALISTMFTDARQRARAIAAWVTALSAGIAIGPVVGGLMLERFWWGSVFLIGVPVMAIVFVVTPIVVAERRDPAVPPFDVASALLLLLTVLPFAYAIKQFGAQGVGPVPLLLVAVAVVVGAQFIRRQRRVANPLVRPSLFADRAFTAALVLLFIGLAAMNGVEYLIPQYLLLVDALPTPQAGLLMVVPAVGLVVGAQVTPLLARRLRAAHVIALGGLLALLAFGAMTTLPADGSGLATVVLATTAMMTGLAPITVLGTGIAVGAAPAAHAGQASSAGQTSYELGLAFGIAVTGSAAAAVYREHVLASAPAGVPTPALTAAANDFGGGPAIAAQLPGGADDALTAVVREGLVAGVHVAAVVGAGLTSVLITLALLLLRPAPTG